MKRNELRKKGTELKPTLQVGKTGITENIKEELASQLEKRELVKIKFLRSMGPSSYWRGDVEEMVSYLGAELIEIKGGTVLVYRKRFSKGPHSNSSSK